MSDDPYYDLWVEVATGIRMLPIEIQHESFRTLDLVRDSGPRGAMISMLNIMPDQKGGFKALVDAYKMLFSAHIGKPYEIMNKDSFDAYMRVQNALEARGEVIYPDSKSSLILLFTLDDEGRDQVENLLMDRVIHSKDEALEIMVQARNTPTAMRSGVL